MVVEADVPMRLDSTSGNELKEERVKVRHTGGVASGEVRRSKTKQLLQANRGAKSEQTMKRKTEQTIK